MLRFTLIIAFMMASLVTSAFLESPNWVEMDATRKEKLRRTNADYVEQGRAPPAEKHEIEIFVKPKNVELLKDMVKEFTDPKSDKYGKHMTKEEMHDLLKNEEGASTVKAYLAEVGAHVDRETESVIYASAPISAWERAFKTEFHTYYSEFEKRTIFRAKEYHLPEKVSDEVGSVQGTIQMPAKLSRRGPAA